MSNLKMAQISIILTVAPMGGFKKLEPQNSTPKYYVPHYRDSQKGTLWTIPYQA